MRSCTNATPVPAPVKGLLRPAHTTRVVDLRRDHPVSPRLRPFVERYWSVRWDRTGRAPFRTEVLSHPSVNVSVESGSHPRFGHPLPSALVHGVVTRRFRLDLTGTGAVTAVKFHPGGYTAFTGHPPRRDSVEPLAGELGVRAEALVAAVLAEPDEADRAVVLDGLLAPAAPEPDPAYTELRALLEVMAADRALVRVAELAAHAGVGVRSLQRLFAGYVGVSPKAVLARYRLQDAAAAIDAGVVDDLAALACQLGWFDQAHFSREFRAVVGTTPSAYLRQARAAGSQCRW